MFSTRNVYRVAFLLTKEDMPELEEALVKQKLTQFKKVEKVFDGPFKPSKYRAVLPYKKRVDELVNMIEERGLDKQVAKQKNAGQKGTSSRAIGVKAEDALAFLKGLNTPKVEALKKAIEKGKISQKDVLNVLASRELIAFYTYMLDVSSKGQAVGKKFALVEGWIDKENVGKIKTLLKKFKAFVFEYIEDPNSPTLLKNKPPFDTFEVISYLYPPLKYGNIDFTPIIAFTFPIIFGIMFASVVDGLGLLIIALFYKWKKGGKFAMLLIWLALASMFFGWLFGEVGFHHGKAIVEVYENPIVLLEIAIAIGIAHTSLGHIIGMVNKAIQKDWKAMFVHLGPILLMIGGVLYLTPYGTAMWASLIVGTLLVLWGGSESIAELPHVIGHVFSYARIFAISMAHYSISTAFTNLADTFFGRGGLSGLTLGISLLATGHAILLTVELLISFIHTLRLHVLEFGTKFIENGLAWFKPDTFPFKYLQSKVARGSQGGGRKQ